MAHHKSAIKRIRTNEERRQRNRNRRSNMRTEIKKWRKLIEEGELEAAKTGLPKLAGLVERSGQKSVMHRNTASRKVSRLAKELNRALAAE